jgi:hypothetical protein
MKRQYCIAMLLLLQACNHSEKGVLDYQNEFENTKNVLNELNNVVITKYGGDAEIMRRHFVIVINPKLARKSLDSQIVDSQLTRMMTTANISAISLQRGKYKCLVGPEFDRIYYRLHKDQYYPTVYFVYNRCPIDSFEYYSGSVDQVSIDRNWEIFIDKK